MGGLDPTDEAEQRHEEMRMEPVGIDGAWTCTPVLHHDSRGMFFEWFRRDDLGASTAYRPEFVQGNCSVSRRGVIRGIHFADVPPGQSKYVTCVSGAVLDAVVDLRDGSPTFGDWRVMRLDDGNRQALYLAEGLGHAFMALSDQATVLYLCSTAYLPGREHAVHPLDPAIGIPWPAETEIILSAKDEAAPSLDEAQRSGLLPDYSECLAYQARRRAAAQPGRTR